MPKATQKGSAHAVQSVARLPGALLTGDIMQQVAQGEAVFVAVVPPCRAGIGSSQTAEMVVVQDWPGVASPGDAGDLEPGGSAAGAEGAFTGPASTRLARLSSEPVLQARVSRGADAPAWQPVRKRRRISRFSSGSGWAPAGAQGTGRGAAV
jgi:hypothetical protein